jgi:hypothetical protein
LSDVILIVAGRLQFRNLRGRRTTVVCCEDDERIVDDVVVIDRFQDLPDRPVDLHCKISVLVDSASPFPFGVRHDRCVWRVQWKVDEERSIGFGLSVDEVNRFFRDSRQHVDRFKTGCCRAFSLKRLFHRGWFGRRSISHVNVGWHIQ